MEWLRWYHGAISDPKWPLIARKSKQNIGTVVAVWAAILEHASQDEERGSIDGFDPEAIDALYGYEDGTCKAVVDAMVDKGLIVDGRLSVREKIFAKEQRDLGVSRSEYESMRSTIFLRDGHRCFYCGDDDGPFECDHVIPVSRGGATDLGNMVVACRTCNRSKSSKTLQEWQR